MLDLKYVTMTTEARAIVTVRGYGFCPDVIFGPLSWSQVPLSKMTSGNQTALVISYQNGESASPLLCSFLSVTLCSFHRSKNHGLRETLNLENDYDAINLIHRVILFVPWVPIVIYRVVFVLFVLLLRRRQFIPHA